ncbi:hypothetical protein HER10_EVM0006852 [Colletotrichum scovillei]|uniref:uncharacterized protein n=1 Tax=Colletotrichum scovillei TaxID=1209932 RepID=UPI0015C3579B|nr:uncharacterized protein HER10_EVM0006852 [Colletotrichum scovillei]KAF4785494.1 hypothetical protein HER10_EVM0006852 [Colletotrichum scovillei]
MESQLRSEPEAENSTLSLAVLSGAEDIVELLLENDRSILQFSEEHSHLNPLHLAAYHRNPEIAEILLANGAKLNIVDELENTPLMVATDRKVESIMRMLLCPRTEDEDLQLDVPDQYGLTPLMLAASLGYEVGVRVLLDSGADLGAICIKSWDSHESNMRTALDYAILHLQDNIVELILAEEYRSIFRDSWVEVPDKISASRMMRSRFVETVQENETPASAVYMPYLSYATQCREEEGEEPFSPTPDVEDDPKNVLQALRAEKYKYEQLLSTYKPGVIHGSSTLDEWYYHFASDQEASKDRKARNESQVVTKGLPGKIEDKDFWPLIRVNQLWIWTIADKWLITASSHPIDGKKNVLLEGVVDHLTKQTESGGSRSLPGSTAEMSRLIIDFCISSYETLPKASRKSSSTTLGVNGTAEEPALRSPTWQFAPNPPASVEYPPELLSMRQMFSNSINKIGIDEANLFAKFSSEAGEILATMNDENQIEEFQVALGIKKPGVESCQAVIDDKSTRKDTDNELERKRQARIKNNLVAIRKAEDLSSRIKDIRDELNILKAVAQYQRDVQREMQKLPGSQEAGLSASHVVNDIKEMDKVADRIQTSVNNTLSLQQTTVSLEMSMAANDQSKLSMKQGKTLMVFTVVTILFVRHTTRVELF